ncbi:MAG: DUF177 domain-containing protein [Chloroflexota bacterium]|nr:DUF177 domain-containing protein [Chloroflexota bacterium]
MQFNVSSLLREHTGAVREYDIDDDLVVDGQRHHARGHTRFDRTPRGVLVRATLDGTASADCSRCLKPITYDVNITIEEEYFPTIDIDSGAKFELAEGEDLEAYRIDVRHFIDLSMTAAEYWAIAQPMAPVCDEACRGLCPDCGAELSAGEHACAADGGDARWSKLANLKLG